MNIKPLSAVVALVALSLSGSAFASQQLACEMLASTWRVDANGKKVPVPGATITIADSRSGWSRTKVTNTKGKQVFRGIRPDSGGLEADSGHQVVTVSADGYATQTFERVECPVGQRIQARFVLEPTGGFANGFE